MIASNWGVRSNAISLAFALGSSLYIGMIGVIGSVTHGQASTLLSSAGFLVFFAYLIVTAPKTSAG